jgi:hypothetical protein
VEHLRRESIGPWLHDEPYEDGAHAVQRQTQPASAMGKEHYPLGQQLPDTVADLL